MTDQTEIALPPGLLDEGEGECAVALHRYPEAVASMICTGCAECTTDGPR